MSRRRFANASPSFREPAVDRRRVEPNNVAGDDRQIGLRFRQKFADVFERLLGAFESVRAVVTEALVR